MGHFLRKHSLWNTSIYIPFSPAFAIRSAMDGVILKNASSCLFTASPGGFHEHRHEHIYDDPRVASPFG